MSKARQVILETLSQRAPLPVDALARAARHSVMATRYHLALLMDEGLVVAQDVAHHERVGRPQVLYSLADDAHTHLPKAYDLLAGQLLAELGRTLSDKDQAALLRRAGKRLAATAPAVRRGARIETRLERAADFLTERGYMAQSFKSAGEYALSVCNCPYREIALTHHAICEMDIALVSALMDMPMRMTQCIARQDGRCTFKPDVKNSK